MAIARKPEPKPAAKSAPAPTIAATETAPHSAEPARPDAVTVIREGADSALAQVREAQEQFRKASEEGLEKTREAYARMKAEAEAVAGSLETSFSAAREGLQSLNSKAFDAIKTQSQLGFEHARALLAAKGPQDIFALHSEFARKQFETFTVQAKELTTHMQTIAAQAFEPLKAAANTRISS